MTESYLKKKVATIVFQIYFKIKIQSNALHSVDILKSLLLLFHIFKIILYGLSQWEEKKVEK